MTHLLFFLPLWPLGAKWREIWDFGVNLTSCVCRNLVFSIWGGLVSNLYLLFVKVEVAKVWNLDLFFFFFYLRACIDCEKKMSLWWWFSRIWGGCVMEPPVEFWASLWSFICFLPYFIALWLLGNIKGECQWTIYGSILLLLFGILFNMFWLWNTSWTQEEGISWWLLYKMQ